MIQNDGRRWRVLWPRSAALVLIVVNVVAYFLQLVLLRAGSTIPDELMLRPVEVVQSGKVWQLFSTLILHDPTRVGHLLYNMIWLWMVAPALEQAWGRRLLFARYFLAGLGGALLTLAVGALHPWIGSFSSVWVEPHVGASGAVLGLVVGWCLLNANCSINLLFIGPIRGVTFLWGVVLIEVLTALSFEPVSSASHFGGMLAGAVLTRELWRPTMFVAAWRRWMLRWRRGRIARKLSRFEVIDGGRNEPRARQRGRDPGDWVN